MSDNIKIEKYVFQGLHHGQLTNCLAHYALKAMLA
jgi:hypothetical protein